ncbi:phage tail protein I [Mycobacterium sp. DL99]|uniref:phage tail protein I n=1 Tax=Mycobacterium sp. DL99 TaxID=2528957 RepID=UPI0010818FEC|nr:phage tail protein I [Mycobacterium sp. DL99]
MAADRALSLVVEPEQWADCQLRDTVPLPGGGVELGWTDRPQSTSCPDERQTVPPGGLAFDHQCRAYRSRAHAIDVLSPGSTERRTVPGFPAPRGLAVDEANRLYVADGAERAVRVLDLDSGRVLHRVVMCGAPVDVAAQCGGVVALIPGAETLFLIEGRSGPAAGPALVRPCYPHGLEAIRVSAGPIILWRNSGGQSVVTRPDGTVLIETTAATDLDIMPDGTIIVAGVPGDPFRRWEPTGDLELEPVGAPDFDGGAICVDPRGHVAYTTVAGIRWTTGSVAKHLTEGTVTIGPLDSRVDRTRWGRAFFTACLPKGTAMSIRAMTADDASTRPIFDDATVFGVYRRPQHDTCPDEFPLYEAPVHAPRGRYLWLEVALKGTERVTPRLRAIRVERPGHALLETLPRVFSRDENNPDYLFRMLAPAEGMLHDLDQKADRRAELLLDPATVRADLLPWLASFLGLALDPRWPEGARRTLLAEAFDLFRYRGTVRALRRMADIYLDRQTQIIEHWQLRGIGGTILGTTPDGDKTPNVGASVRETGTLGRFTVGGTVLQPTSFATSAHRFTLLIPGNLTDEQCEVLTGLLQTQAPAHTAGSVQELGAGMRVGTVRVGITSFVGPAADWIPLRLGEVRLGADGIIGTPAIGSRLGQDSYAGQVLVG